MSELSRNPSSDHVFPDSHAIKEAASLAEASRRGRRRQDSCHDLRSQVRLARSARAPCPGRQGCQAPDGGAGAG